jgi:uncharacterized protein
MIGALLAWPLYAAFGPAIDEPMYRFVTRGGMLVALLGLAAFLRYLSLNNAPALGYGVPRGRFARDLAQGLAAGVAIMLPLVMTLLLLDVRTANPDWVFSWPDLILAILEGLLIGLVVALIEETFFRGAMFTAVVRSSGLWPAAILTSLLYAALHFLRTDYDVSAHQLAWYSGFVVLAHLFEQYATPAAIIDSFLALFAVGVFLALVRARHGHIAHCIGLHAGWVLTIKLTKDVTQADENARLSFLVGDYDHVIGYLAFGLIALLSIAYYVFFLRPRLAARTAGTMSGPASVPSRCEQVSAPSPSDAPSRADRRCIRP